MKRFIINCECRRLHSAESEDYLLPYIFELRFHDVRVRPSESVLFAVGKDGACHERTGAQWRRLNDGAATIERMVIEAVENPDNWSAKE